MRTLLAMLGLAALLGGARPAQTPPAPAQRDGVIAGQVVDAGTGRPVSAAIVSVAGTAIPLAGPSASPRILTGADGRFVFTGLPIPGRFSVNAYRSGYADGAYGMSRPGGSSQSIELAPAQTSAAIVVRLWKYGVITGTVTDEAGEPVVGMQVRAVQRRAGAARPFTAAVGAAMTDDRGVYRFGSLLPGEYLVVGSQPGLSAPASVFNDVARTGRATGELAGLVAGASLQGLRVGEALYGTGRGSVTPPPPNGTRMQIYPPTFHPGAISPAQATIVTIGSGEERSSIDLHLAPVTTTRVSGTLIGPAGPAGMIPLRLLSAAGGDLIPADALGPIGITDSAGTFVFPAVVPGNYILRNDIRASPGVGWVAMPITVAGDDVDGIVATLQPHLRITARLQFEGGAAPPTQLAPNLFALEPEDGSPTIALGVPNADALTSSGYAAGRYRVRVFNSPSGWMFKGAMLDGVDVSLTPFDFSRDISDLTLVFTDRWSGVGGAVQGPRADRAVVILFPTDSRAWVSPGPSPRRLRSARVDAQGAFGIRSVPAGDYYVVAIPDEQSGDWRDPAVLDGLARIATQVTVSEGEHQTIDLQLKEIRQ